MRLSNGFVIDKYGRGYAIGDMGHTDYVLVADDIVAVEEK